MQNSGIREVQYDLPEMQSGARTVANAWARVPRTLSPQEKQACREKIKRLLKEKNAVLVAHYYVDGDIQDLAEEFEAETGIKIDFQISPDAQWRDLIKVKLDSGEAPDIICVDTPIGLASSIHMDEYCVDLSDQEWVERMDESARSAVSVDDKTYGITFAGAKMYFYLYNKDIFNELGLEVPTTYEEFKDVCQTILDSGTTPIYEATTNGWHQVLPLFETGGLWLADDPEIYNELNANEKDLDDIPQLLTIIEQLQECAEAGYFGEDYLSNAWENAKEAIATEKCAMTIAELGFRGEIDGYQKTVHLVQYPCG